MAERHFERELCKVTGAIDLTSEKVTNTEEEDVEFYVFVNISII